LWLAAWQNGNVECTGGRYSARSTTLVCDDIASAFLKGLLAGSWHRLASDASDDSISQLASKFPTLSSGSSGVARNHALRVADSARRRKSSSKCVKATISSVALLGEVFNPSSWVPLDVLPTHGWIHGDQAE
jgi:hypothetical protein